MAEYDIDRDGFLNLAEMTDLAETYLMKGASDQKITPKKAMDHFKATDIDANGKVDKNELMITILSDAIKTKEKQAIMV